nr:glycosyltransferase family 4 protein [Virgibacillus halodenitrificans]
MCTVLAEAFYKSRHELIIEFVNLGYEIILVAPDSEDFQSKQFNGINVKYYQINLERTGLNPIRDFKAIKQLRQIILNEKPEISYAFGGAKAAIYTSIAASKEKVTGNYCMINGLGSIFRGAGFKNKVIKNVMTFLFKYSLSKSRGVLFQNQDDLSEFTNRGLVSTDKCLIVNGSGVNLNRFNFSDVPSNDVFLFVGRLLKDKGIYEYINAAKIIKQKYPHTEFWIVGGYDSNPTAVKESEMSSWVECGLVKYFGRKEDVLPFYQDCSVYVLPSYHEGTPRTCLEAMAVGRPTITTNAPGCKETVLNGKTGFLVPIKDSVALAEKMEHFISNPRDKVVMGENALAFVKEKYDVNKVNKSIIQFISK